MLSIFEDFAKQLAVHNRKYNNFLLSTILTFDTFDTCFPLLFFISNIFFDKCIFSSKIFFCNRILGVKYVKSVKRW